MKKTNRTINTKKRPYEAPHIEIVTINSRAYLLTVSGAGEYNELRWGGGSGDEYGD